MALKNSLDPPVVAARLAEAIERRVPGATGAEVTDVHVPHSSGMSNETVLFAARWTGPEGPCAQRLAARVQPAGPAVFPRYDLGLEFTVMSALAAHTDVPVPAMYFHEPDPGPLGAPFLVMRRVDGLVPPDDPPYTAGGWMCDLRPEQRAGLHDGALRTLARIHACDLDAVGLAALREHPEAGVDGQLRLWRDGFAWAAEGQTNPTVEAALDWVQRHRPAESGPPVLTWGDARLGNLIFRDDPDDPAVLGVLDWEMLCVGPRELDLGWWSMMLRYYSEGIGVPPLPGLPDSGELAARYTELTGHPVVDLHFHEVLAALRLSVLMHRAGNLMVAAGQLPPGSPMNVSNPASHLLARMLELPAPEGDVQSFAGNRGA